MTGADHERYHEWSAAYALGALEPSERTRYEQHLESCPVCRDDVAGFAPIPGLLSRIGPDDLDEHSTQGRTETLEKLENLVQLEIRDVVRRGRWWRAAACVATAAALVLAVLVARPEAASNDANVVAAVVTATQADSASIGTVEKGWGTEIRLQASNLPDRDTYQLWTIDADGRWVQAASWSATPTRGARVTGASSTQLSDIDRIVVTSGSRTDVVIDAHPDR